jgi:hypothetical protein
MSVMFFHILCMQSVRQVAVVTVGSVAKQRALPAVAATETWLCTAAAYEAQRRHAIACLKQAWDQRCSI